MEAGRARQDWWGRRERSTCAALLASSSALCLPRFSFCCSSFFFLALLPPSLSPTYLPTFPAPNSSQLQTPSRNEREWEEEGRKGERT